MQGRGMCRVNNQEAGYFFQTAGKSCTCEECIIHK